MNNLRSVSSILKAARIQKGIELAKASQDLKIHMRFLTALEDGDYSVFSSVVHLKGFLKNYASYLGLNVGEILAFFRREYPEEGYKRVENPFRPLEISLTAITPERVISGITIALIIAFFGYLFFQYRSFANAPLLDVHKPSKDIKTIESVINVSGKTDKDAVLKINGQSISLSDQGEFSAAITLLDGANVLNFVSRNKLGRESKISRVVVYEKPVSQELPKETSPSAQPLGLSVTVKVGPNASWVEVKGTADDKPLFQGLMVAGVYKTFSDPVSIKIKTGNGGSTSVVLDGQDLGKLGQEGDVVEKEFRK